MDRMEHKLFKSYQVNYNSHISTVRYSAHNPYYVYVCLAVFMAHVHFVKPHYFESYHVFFIVIISWDGGETVCWPVYGLLYQPWPLVQTGVRALV